MVTQVISSIVEALSSFLAGLGGAIVDFFDGIFLVTTAETITLSNFGIFTMVLFGVSISFAVVRWIFRLVKAR